MIEIKKINFDDSELINSLSELISVSFQQETPMHSRKAQ